MFYNEWMKGGARVMLGIGLDLVEIQRVANLLERQGETFLVRLLTEAERATMPSTMSPERRAEWVAGRFAAKEAALKAIGTGMGALSFHDVEITADDLGKPVLTVSDAVQQRYAPALPRFLVTITHTTTTAAAAVVIS